MDTSFIGNARQQADNDIAVLNAVTLGKCCQHLADRLSADDLHPSDYLPEQKAHFEVMSGLTHGTPDANWVKANLLHDKAVRLLRDAIAGGALQLWRVHLGHEVPLTPMTLDEGNIRYGIFKSLGHPDKEMQGATLWVKQPDWQSFMAMIESQRADIGGDFHNRKSENKAKPERKKPGPKPDPNWIAVEETVLANVIKAGYSLPLKRGEKAAIATQLLEEMERITGNFFSPAISLKRAKNIIERLSSRE